MLLETEQREVKFFGHNVIYYVSQVIIAIALFAVCYRLFYHQAIGGPVARHFGNEGVAALESAMVVLTWHFAGRLIDKISGFSSIVSLYVSLGLIFLANIHLPIFDAFYMMGFYILGGYYQIVDGVPADQVDVIVNIIDDATGEQIESGSYKNFINNQNNNQNA